MIDLVGIGRAAVANGTARRYGGFVLGGALAFLTDATLLVLMTRSLGWSPFLARPIGISIAMVVSWLVNRTISFPQSAPPSVAEYLKFAAVSWSAQVINYCVFAVILLVVPRMEPLAALVIACLVSMFFSYNGYKLGVFKREPL